MNSISAQGLALFDNEQKNVDNNVNKITEVWIRTLGGKDIAVYDTWNYKHESHTWKQEDLAVVKVGGQRLHQV